MRQAFQQKSISLPREVTPSPCARWVIPLRDGRRSWKIGSRTQEFFEKMGQAIVLDERACTSSPRNVCYSGNSLVLADRRSPGFWLKRSEEHTSELQSLMRISYAVFCLKKKKKQNQTQKTQKHIKLTETHTEKMHT